MKNLYKQKRQEGFTIIEVMIVLAIAAVILLIVLLAVPALQRTSRNTQRTNDASQIVSAINECLSNQNGIVANCEVVNSGTGATAVTNRVDIDLTKLGQLNTTPTWAGAGNIPAGTTTKAVWQFAETCGTDGNTPTADPNSTRDFVVDYQVETSNGATQRCLAS